MADPGSGPGFNTSSARVSRKVP